MRKKKQLLVLQTNLKSLPANSSAYALEKLNYENALADYNATSKLADEYALATQQNMSGIQIIEAAYPAEKKIKPINSRICMATTILSFILACLGALLAEQFVYIKQEINKA